MPYNVILERGNKAPVIIARDIPTSMEAQAFVIEHFKEFFTKALVEIEALNVQLPGDCLHAHDRGGWSRSSSGMVIAKLSIQAH